MREQRFKSRVASIEAHNSRWQKGQETYFQGEVNVIATRASVRQCTPC